MTLHRATGCLPALAHCVAALFEGYAGLDKRWGVRIPSTTRRRPWPKVAVVQVVLPENDPLFLSSPCQPLSTLDKMYYFVETAAV